MVPLPLRAIFGRIPLFLRTWSNERPLTNSKSSLQTFSQSLRPVKHCCLLSFPSQEMSLNIDIKRILPVKVSGVCPNELSRLLILSQSCNVVNPGKIFHSNSARFSFYIVKIAVVLLGSYSCNSVFPSLVAFRMLKNFAET